MCSQWRVRKTFCARENDANGKQALGLELLYKKFIEKVKSFLQYIFIFYFKCFTFQNDGWLSKVINSTVSQITEEISTEGNVGR